MNRKVKSPVALAGILARERRKGKTVVFTNGCFDILHVGHSTYLKKAKALGDILVIGLNSDSSVKTIKGPSRPVNNERDRAEILSSLESVDYITVFSEPTPAILIEKLAPDILVKGGDWRAMDIVGAESVRKRGGRVVTIPFVKGYSTSSLLKKIHKGR